MCIKKWQRNAAKKNKKPRKNRQRNANMKISSFFKEYRLNLVPLEIGYKKRGIKKTGFLRPELHKETGCAQKKWN